MKSALLAKLKVFASFLFFSLAFPAITLSCTPSLYKDKKRIDKAVERRGPEWVIGYVLEKYNVKNVMRKDTVEKTFVERDTIKADTVFLLKETTKYDTIKLEKERLKVRLVQKRDTIYLSGECQTDTIFVYKTITEAIGKEEAIKKYKWLDTVYSIKDLTSSIMSDLKVIILVLVLLAAVYAAWRIYRRFILP